MTHLNIREEGSMTRRSIEDAQRLLDRKGKRKHKKRHRVNDERSFLGRTKHARIMGLVADIVAKKRSYNQSVRAYWLGFADGHPCGKKSRKITFEDLARISPLQRTESEPSTRPIEKLQG